MGGVSYWSGVSEPGGPVVGAVSVGSGVVTTKIWSVGSAVSTKLTRSGVPVTR